MLTESIILNKGGGHIMASNFHQLLWRLGHDSPVSPPKS